MKSFGITKRGLVRQENEDAFIIEHPSLFIVADGMGGHAGGEIASRTAVETIREYVRESSAEWRNEITLKDAVLAANTAIRDYITAQPDFDGMGTTTVAAYLEDDIVFWAHVGDSRLYTYYRGTLKQITHDHSLVSELLRDGRITEEQAEQHPSRHVITRSVGTTDSPEVDTGRLRLEPETMLLLCSDGLYNMVDEAEIRDIMIANENAPESCARHLLKRVYDHGAKDNVTIVVVAYR